MSLMSKQEKVDGQMRQLFNREAELARSLYKKFPNNVPIPTLDERFYRELAIKIDGRKYTLVRQRTSEDQDELTVTFSPMPEDNLQYKPGRGNRFLSGFSFPTFTICQEGAFGVWGHLNFDRRIMKRTHWWSRLGDLFDKRYPEIKNLVGCDRGANIILGNLVKRLSGEPTEINPVEPEKWLEMVETRP